MIDSTPNESGLKLPDLSVVRAAKIRLWQRRSDSIRGWRLTRVPNEVLGNRLRGLDREWRNLSGGLKRRLRSDSFDLKLLQDHHCAGRSEFIADVAERLKGE